MSVDLGDYVEAMQATVTLPDITEDQWIQKLSNAFWTARLNGHFVGYTETDGVINTVPTGGTDLPREQVQLIILYAEYNAVFQQLTNLKTAFRGKAGPVEVETQRSANLLTALLKDLSTRMKDLKDTLLQAGGSATYIWDSVIEHEENLLYGDSWWTG